MTEFKFIDFIPTPKEKTLGITTFTMIDSDGKTSLHRFRISPNPKGGYFIQPPAVKIDNGEREEYLPTFLLDSNIDNTQLQKVLREGVRPYLSSDVKPEAQVPTTSTLSDADVPF